MKKFITFSFAFVALTYLSACSSEPSSSDNITSNPETSSDAIQKSENSDTTIVAFIDGTGPDEPAAKAFERGMELAVDEKSMPSVKVLDRSKVVTESTSLKAPIAVYWQTSDLLPVAPKLKELETIAVPVWDVTKKVASLGNKVFGFGYATDRSFANYAKFAGKNLKSYRFAIISSSADPFTTQSKAFIEETKSQGNTVVFEENTVSDVTDFSAIFARATQEKCDTVFAVLPSEVLVKFIKAARASSYSGKILVGDSLFSTESETLGKDAEGIYLLQAWSDDAALKAKYTAKFGAEPDGVTLGAAALGFDLMQCIERVGPNPIPSSISYNWLSSPCEGLTGITQFSGERISQRVKRVLTVKGGKFELVG